MKKIIIRFLCVASFAVMPLFADEEPTLADEQKEITVEEVINFEEPKTDVADEIAALEEEIINLEEVSIDITNDEEVKPESTETQEAVG